MAESETKKADDELPQGSTSAQQEVMCPSVVPTDDTSHLSDRRHMSQSPFPEHRMQRK